MITLQECKELFKSKYWDETLDFLQNGINDLDFSDLIEDYEIILSEMDVKFKIWELIWVWIIVYVIDDYHLIHQIWTMEFKYKDIESFYFYMETYNKEAKAQLYDLWITNKLWN